MQQALAYGAAADRASGRDTAVLAARLDNEEDMIS
jgi:hypothetical protein